MYAGKTCYLAPKLQIPDEVMAFRFGPQICTSELSKDLQKLLMYVPHLQN